MDKQKDSLANQQASWQVRKSTLSVMPYKLMQLVQLCKEFYDGQKQKEDEKSCYKELHSATETNNKCIPIAIHCILRVNKSHMKCQNHSFDYN